MEPGLAPICSKYDAFTQDFLGNKGLPGLMTVESSYSRSLLKSLFVPLARLPCLGWMLCQVAQAFASFHGTQQRDGPMESRGLTYGGPAMAPDLTALSFKPPLLQLKPIH